MAPKVIYSKKTYIPTILVANFGHQLVGVAMSSIDDFRLDMLRHPRLSLSLSGCFRAVNMGIPRSDLAYGSGQESSATNSRWNCLFWIIAFGSIYKGKVQNSRYSFLVLQNCKWIATCSEPMHFGNDLVWIYLLGVSAFKDGKVHVHRE